MKTASRIRRKAGHGLRSALRLLYTLTYFIWLFPLRLYDIIHGTEYAGIGKTGDRDGRFEYYPSPVISFLFLRRYIRKHMQNGMGHSVLDIGCGKGIVLHFFSQLCFDRVSGIEFDKKLFLLARKNLRNTPGPIKVYMADAEKFSGYKYYDTFYLYNPFDETILEKCLDRIFSTMERFPRKITIFYCNPVYGDILRKRGFKEEGHFYYKTVVFVYEKGILGEYE